MRNREIDRSPLGRRGRGRYASIGGISLVEALLAALLIAGVGVLIALFFPAFSRLQLQNKIRAPIDQTLVSYIDSITRQPFDAVPVTPLGDYSVEAKDCGCEEDPQFIENYTGKADPGSPSAQLLGPKQIQIGELPVTLTTCVNLAELDSHNAFEDKCPADAANAQAKKVVVRARYYLGGKEKSVALKRYVTREGQKLKPVSAGITIQVDSARVDNPDQGQDPVSGGEVTLYDKDYVFGGNTNGQGEVSFKAYPGTYTLRVIKAGFYPYVDSRFIVGDQAITRQVHLRAVGLFSGSVLAESYDATHVVISKVVCDTQKVLGHGCGASGAADCRDIPIELVELYNPTAKEIVVNLRQQLMFYRYDAGPSQWSSVKLGDLPATNIDNNPNIVFPTCRCACDRTKPEYLNCPIAPGGHLLIQGFGGVGDLVEPPWGNEFPPDVYYAGDLITCGTGGIQVYGNGYDKVSWTGNDGAMPSTNPVKEGRIIPSGQIQPRRCYQP